MTKQDGASQSSVGPETSSQDKPLGESTRELTYLGHRSLYPSETLIGRFLEAGRGWDTVLGEIIPALLPTRTPTIVEIGANIGASTMQILAARPEARVIAFEPSSRFRPYLLRNLELAEAKNVEVYPWAVGREHGELSLFNNDSTASVMSRDYGGGEFRGEETVPVVTLDGLPVSRLDFLKIDTDGFEFEVLRGGENALRTFRPALHFEFATYLIPEPEEQLAWLQALGYESFLCLTPTGRRIGVTDDPEQTSAWAAAEESRYCDIVTCFKGSAGAKMEDIDL